MILNFEAGGESRDTDRPDLGDVPRSPLSTSQKHPTWKSGRGASSDPVCEAPPARDTSTECLLKDSRRFGHHWVFAGAASGMKMITRELSRPVGIEPQVVHQGRFEDSTWFSGEGSMRVPI